jgi:hypothetical protein
MKMAIAPFPIKKEKFLGEGIFVAEVGLWEHPGAHRDPPPEPMERIRWRKVWTSPGSFRE